MMQEDNYSAKELVKMDQVVRSLKRGLADIDAGRLSDGDMAITHMIEMEEDVAADGIG